MHGECHSCKVCSRLTGHRWTGLQREPVADERAWSVSPQADPLCGPKTPPCSLPLLTKVTIPVTQAKASFSTVLTRACYQGQWVVIKKGAHLTTVLLGHEDLQHLADL